MKGGANMLDLATTTKLCPDRLVYVSYVLRDGARKSERKTLMQHALQGPSHSYDEIDTLVVRDAAFGYVITELYMKGLPRTDD